MPVAVLGSLGAVAWMFEHYKPARIHTPVPPKPTDEYVPGEEAKKLKKLLGWYAATDSNGVVPNF